MTQLFEPTHRGEHGQDCFDDHPPIPGAALARFHIGWIARFGMEAHVGQDHHLVLKISDQGMKRGVWHIGCGIIPGDDQASVVDHVGQLRANNPAMVGQALAPNLPIGPILAPGMAQFDAIAVSDTQDGRLRQKEVCPVGVRVKQAKQARAVRQAGKPGRVVAPEPAIEGAWADALKCKQERQRHDLAGMQIGLWMLRHRPHPLVNPIEQGNDKIVRRHADLLAAGNSTLLACKDRMSFVNNN